ncbi:MAG: hypothetical protein H6R10_1289 [Rhodocyclaceae bacterium]|nr:hypothetical protein [Rhodocyclaceae bacterium]
MTARFPPPSAAASPFDLADADTYRRWRDWKLANAPARAEDLVVEVRDPRAPTAAELSALVSRCRTANMAIYASACPDEDKDIPRRLGKHLGLARLDSNWLADQDGVSSITPRSQEEGARADFIPYTHKPIRWHTDGYYNPPERQVRGMVLHCVRPASAGGENALMDHEIAYILLRDGNPEAIRALMSPAAMTIPARTDESGVARAAQAGPVFSVDPASGDLHMRYTARTRSIEWHDDPVTREAVASLRAILDGGGPHVYRLGMTAGMGLVCNNVLHDRAGFDDAEGGRRLLYRARYYDRIAGTLGSFRV